MNRYEERQNALYQRLISLLYSKDFFVITTNVDHFFQDNGFPKERLFYTQGDYGLWQCSVPCHDATYDNYDTVRRMVAEQKAMRVPRELVPHCPRCGEPMGMNLRADRGESRSRLLRDESGGSRRATGDRRAEHPRRWRY